MAPPPLLPLPIDPLLPEIVAALERGPSLVLAAEPGAGKTTRVPRALLDAGFLETGECWVLEPRRLAARLAAQRVAEELGEEPGQRVGYAVRFERRVSRATRVRFVTEALLLHRLQEDPLLRGIRVVILDEFHERHLHTDLALTLLRRLQRGGRSDLRLLAMSATVDAGPLCAWLEAPLLSSTGRGHPVEIRHLERPSARPLPELVAEALAGLHGEGEPGHSLVFLPGAAEIRACERACAGLAARGIQVLPLHGSLGFEAQKAAVAPSAVPRILLSTNVAESSITIPGIRHVVDSGLGREATHSPWSGLPELRTAKVSQARCVQRAGRAGRTGPGLCLRLFTEAEFRARPAFDPPEILRSDLAEALLLLHGLGVSDPASLDWFQAPPGEALASAAALLRRLGALEEGGLSPMGRRLAARPLHPRLGRLVAAGEDLGIGDLALLAALLLEVGGLEARQGLDAGGRPGGAHALDSDLLARLDPFLEAEALGPQRASRLLGLDAGALQQARQARQSLLGGRPLPEPGPEEESRLLQAVLRAYPDRVARSGGSGTYALCGGGGARLAQESRVRGAELLVALEAGRQPGGAQVLIRAASKVEPEWILDAFPEELREEVQLLWNPEKGRVERRSTLAYGAVFLEDIRRPAKGGEPGVAACLAQALEAGAGAGASERLESLDALLDRAAFLGRMRPELGIGQGPALRRRLLEQACAQAASLKELEGLDWEWALRELLGPEGGRLLEAWAPTHVQLPRRRVKVNYDGERPWIESRLQDFLGLRQGPAVAGGALPLVLHLLAPNGRAVQVTTDLEGFWQRAYRELRPQLSRRYPRHAWPEDPLQPGPEPCARGPKAR